MSELLTLVDGITTGTIYGTDVAATNYITGMYGDSYTAWLALTADNKKRTLIAATRYIDRQGWADAVNTFALRDAYTNDAGAYLFQLASYELAALIADDASLLTAADTSSNVKGIGAGSARVDFFNPTSRTQGTASLLPPVIEVLIGAFLVANTASGPDGGTGQSGSCHNPFSSCSDYDRKEPF